MTAPCRICAAAGPHAEFTAREMMFGSRERFAYFQCRECGCLQIAEVPADLARHYPPDYYSLDDDPRVPLGFMPEWCNTMLGSAVVPDLVQRAYRTEDERDRALAGRALDYYFPQARPPLGARILDVGCGAGTFLCALRALGYERLLGADAYLRRDLTHRNGLRVLKGSLDRVDPDLRWDLVMFHHSFEHLPDPHATLRTVTAVLAEGGACLVRVPVLGQAWADYGVDWVQLDPPRHLFLHSRDSLRRLAGQCGLAVAEIRDDSTAFQFWGSEQYARDIPLRSPRSFAVDPAKSPFSRADVAEFERRAARRNAEGRGDQAAFVLRRPS